jgi:hypothetical protein
MPQFVILRHTLPADSPRASHFDLMLEQEGQLLTWAMAELPNATSQLAEELPPHRIDYLTYEGPVSNNRGEVMRVRAGSFEWLVHDAHQIRVRLDSPQLTGEFRLERRVADCWTCQFISG